jgi:hypothetical protein
VSSGLRGKEKEENGVVSGSIGVVSGSIGVVSGSIGVKKRKIKKK